MDPIFQNEYLIDGQLLKWEGPHQQVTSYFSETSDSFILGHYPLLDSDTALQILKSAQTAYQNGSGQWPTMHPLQRSSAVKHFVKIMKQNKTEIVKRLMYEIGKTQIDSENEFDRTVEYINETIKFYENKVKKLSKLHKIKNYFAQIGYSPRGICLCMGPYNYPLNETLTIIIPALLTGNVVIFKPPRLGVLLHQPLLKAFATAFPPGVVNTIYGEGQKVISPIMQSGLIDVLAFIGSSKVADIVKNQHPHPHRLHTIFGLEAKNPAIILPDADITTSINECLIGSLSYNGQRCTAIKIVFVHKSISSEFVAKFSQQIDNLNIGLPWITSSQITPLPELPKIQYLLDLTQDAISQGAQITNKKGGHLKGTWFFPLVLYPVNLNSRIAKEEQFGPIIPIVPFQSIDEIVNYINESPYGQQLSIFTNDYHQIKQITTLIGNQTSRININSSCQRGPDTLPFTGRKNSAQGVLSVREALRAFSIPLVLAGKQSKANKIIFNKSFNQDQKTVTTLWNKLKTQKS